MGNASGIGFFILPLAGFPGGGNPLSRRRDFAVDSSIRAKRR
jgi:hypothetical protein